MSELIDTSAAGNAAASTSMTLTVRRKSTIAEGITLFELAYPDGRELPPFEAGAHIALTTPNGLLRRYSLCNAPSERQRYIIAIMRDEDDSGGSKSMIDELAEGATVAVSAPLNYFPLAQNTTSASARRCAAAACRRRVHAKAAPAARAAPGSSAARPIIGTMCSTTKNTRATS